MPNISPASPPRPLELFPRHFGETTRTRMAGHALAEMDIRKTSTQRICEMGEVLARTGGGMRSKVGVDLYPHGAARVRLRVGVDPKPSEQAEGDGIVGA